MMSSLLPMLSGKPKSVLTIIGATLLLVACQTPTMRSDLREVVRDIDGTWRAYATSDTGRAWRSTMRISSNRFEGTVSCDPFPPLRVSGDVGKDRAIYFIVNEGRREIPAMGQYFASGKFPSLEIRHQGGRCGSAVLLFAR